MGLKDIFRKKKEKDDVVNIQRDTPAGWDKNSVSLPKALKAQQYRQKSQQIDEELKRLVEDEKRYNYLAKQIKEFDKVTRDGEIKKINKNIDKNARKLEKERIVERKKLLEETKQNLTKEYGKAIESAERDSNLDKLSYIEQNLRGSTFFYDYPSLRSKLSRQIEDAHARVIDNIIKEESFKAKRLDKIENLRNKTSENVNEALLIDIDKRNKMTENQMKKEIEAEQKAEQAKKLSDKAMQIKQNEINEARKEKKNLKDRGIYLHNLFRAKEAQRQKKEEISRWAHNMDKEVEKGMREAEEVDDIMKMGAGARDSDLRPPGFQESDEQMKEWEKNREKNYPKEFPKGINKEDKKKGSEGGNAKCPKCGSRDVDYEGEGIYHCNKCGYSGSSKEFYPEPDDSGFSELTHSSFVPVAIAAFIGLMIPVIFGANIGTALLAVGIIFLGLSKI